MCSRLRDGSLSAERIGVATVNSILVAQVMLHQSGFRTVPGRDYSARVDSSSGAIDMATRTLLIQLLIDNSAKELLPGAYAEVRFTLHRVDRGASFRLLANVLLSRADQIHVATVVPSGRVALKPVEIGQDFGSSVEIVEGLNASDDVILNPRTH
jgi:multidrug efflux pump subunit AcrA (membrane-fusion protein)